MRILRNCVSKIAAKRLFKSLPTVVLAAGLALTGSMSAAHANSKYAGIVIDARSGKTLYAYKADSPRYPASLTKMMTLYMVFDALERGKITKKTRIRMSKTANSRPPSRIAIGTGQTLSVDSAIRALVTKSANNVAAAIGEHLGGSESNFAKMMTKKAHALGMKSTTFRNASGLPNRAQKTTARDMAKLGLALREHFPDQYSYFSTRSFKFGKHRYGNHNRLLGRVKGVDGIKTGYTRASGFNLVSSVNTGGRRIVAVVLGGRSGSSRNAQMQKLISRYLGKATRRGGKQLIASKSTVRNRAGNLFAGGAVARVSLPKSVDIPVLRAATFAVATSTNEGSAPLKPTAAPNRISQAMVASVSAPTPRFRPSNGPRTLNGRDELAAFMAKAALQNKAPAANDNGVVQAFAPQSAPTRGEVATASITTPPKGWHIQIAAVPTTDSAVKMHSRAKQAGAKVLRGKQTWTQEIDKNGTALYRVRFTGFDSKNQARNACKYLKQKKFACLAINQS